MQNNLKLSKPFTSLSGVEISELKFNFDGLKPSDYRQMLRIESKIKGISQSNDFITTKKTVPEFRMAAGWVAAVKGTDGICIDDIDNLNLLDLLELEDVGLLFFANLG